MKKSIALIFILCLVISCKKMQNEFLIIGHRGAMGHETENSIPSIEKAVALGVDMIEIDVFKIKSGEIVVFHDQELSRLTNGSGLIEDYSYYKLNQLNLEGGHKIPMLQDVLKVIDNKVALNIELKGANTAQKVNQIMTHYVEKMGWQWQNFVISSFNWEELRAMRELNKKVAIAVLTEAEDATKAVPTAKALQAIAVNPWFKNLTQAQVNAIHAQGFKVFPYTVNEPEDIARMRKYGVDGIFINYPERAM